MLAHQLKKSLKSLKSLNYSNIRPVNNYIVREYSDSLSNNNNSKKETTSPVSTSEVARQRAERKKVVDDGSFLALFRLAKQNFFMIKKHLSIGEIIMLLFLGIPGVGVLYKYFYEIPNEGTKT